MNEDDSMTEPGRGPDTAGGLLRAAREKQGLHIAALAAAIKVTPRKLEALESNRWDELPDATFARALAQTVCRSLKIDPRPVLDLLPAVGLGRLENVAGSLNTPFNERGSQPSGMNGGSFRPLVWAGGLLLLAAVLVYLVPSQVWTGLVGGEAAQTAPLPAFPASEAGVSAAEPLPAAAPPPAWDAASEPGTALAAEAAASLAAPASPAASAAASAPAAAGSAPAAAATPASATADAIRVQAVQASWVEARDAQGRVLVSRLVPAGEQLVLEGTLPVRLVIGNAVGVELSFRQQRIDLPALTRDNVARLQLP